MFRIPWKEYKDNEWNSTNNSKKRLQLWKNIRSRRDTKTRKPAKNNKDTLEEEGQGCQANSEGCELRKLWGPERIVLQNREARRAAAN